ncbi:MAG: isoprenylcysteine carboxylmethyltransferase family protein [Candidatus Diapherotrites archaeon]
MEMKVMPPSYFVLTLILIIGTHLMFPITLVISPPYSYSGIILVVFGIIMNLWADSLFKKMKTTVKPNESPTSMITSDPFKISRHPMYCGMAAILLGVAVFLGSIAPFVFPVAFIILMEIGFIAQEEKKMATIFGSKYLDYKRKVRRWV